MESTQEQRISSLETVQGAFERFRKTKLSRQTPFPESLWQMARPLTAHYERTHLSRALKITSEQYHQFLLQKKAPTPAKKQQFISLPLSPVKAQPQPIAKILLPNGIAVDLLCPSALTALVGQYATTHSAL
jgi:hypothetical protein